MSDNINPRKIQVLPPELRDQIAAGEVVERPASVLKELMENSLDAGADQIDVSIEDGGRTYLSVRDNGFGMGAADLALAVTSHATSKVHSFAELLRVSSYGFRGEALPSVGSVARLKISSAARATAGDYAEAYFIEVLHGKIIGEGPTAIAGGTLVEVHDLFANVPARLKFLKTNSTEQKRCQEVVTRLALARPGVGFGFSAGGREIYRFLPQEDLAARLAKLWPPQITSQMAPFDFTRNGIRAYGLAGSPKAAQPKGDRMLFYVNGRAVNDRLMLRAARDAYKGRLLAREYPQLVLFMELDPEEVDVNVHPAKNEVRFRDERAVFGAVLRAVESAFAADMRFFTGPDAEGHDESFAGGAFGKAGQERFLFPPLNDGDSGSLPKERPLGFWGEADRVVVPAVWGSDATGSSGYESDFGPDARPAARDSMPGAFPGGGAGAAGGGGAHFAPGNESSVCEPGAAFMPDIAADGGPDDFRPGAGNNFENGLRERTYAEAEIARNSGDISGSFAAAGGAGGEWARQPVAGSGHLRAGEAAPLPGGMLYMGQVADTYLIVLRGAELLLLDQHAVHERILLHRFKTEAQSGQSQLLAIPLELRLHPAESERLREIWRELVQLGFSLAAPSATLLEVRGIPPVLDTGEAREFLRDALAEKGAGMTPLLNMMACKGAIKAGQRLSRDEALALLHKWLQTPDKEFCPHGRPAVLRFGAAELERLFKRKV